MVLLLPIRETNANITNQSSHHTTTSGGTTNGWQKMNNQLTLPALIFAPINVATNVPLKNFVSYCSVHFDWRCRLYHYIIALKQKIYVWAYMIYRALCGGQNVARHHVRAGKY
jgi:hypothetical protein